MRYAATAVVLSLALGLALLPGPGTAADDKDWGTLKGRIVYEGDKVPDPEPANVNKDEKHCLANGKIFSEKWVVNKENKGVRWAIVWLVPEPGKELKVHDDLKKIKEMDVTIDQPCCALVPHVVALREGQNLVAKNSAPVVHNIRWTGSKLLNPGGSVIIPAGGAHTIKDLRAQKLPLIVGCDIHPWMKGYAAVFKHPYFTVTNENGEFEIKQAPAGDCRYIVWQEAIGFRGGEKGADGEKVTIKGGGVTDVGKLGVKAEK